MNVKIRLKMDLLALRKSSFFTRLQHYSNKSTLDYTHV